jgi:hypothetical protein
VYHQQEKHEKTNVKEDVDYNKVVTAFEVGDYSNFLDECLNQHKIHVMMIN